jgi:hypothetical protein
MYVPLGDDGLCKPGAPPTGLDHWAGTALDLPPTAPFRWRDAFSGREIKVTSCTLEAADALAQFPLALLTNVTD